MPDQEVVYSLKRAEQERARSEAAEDPAVARIHAELAVAYAMRAMQPDNRALTWSEDTPPLTSSKAPNKDGVRKPIVLDMGEGSRIQGFAANGSR